MAQDGEDLLFTQIYQLILETLNPSPVVLYAIKIGQVRLSLFINLLEFSIVILSCFIEDSNIGLIGGLHSTNGCFQYINSRLSGSHGQFLLFLFNILSIELHSLLVFYHLFSITISVCPFIFPKNAIYSKFKDQVLVVHLLNTIPTIINHLLLALL